MKIEPGIIDMSDRWKLALCFDIPTQEDPKEVNYLGYERQPLNYEDNIHFPTTVDSSRSEDRVVMYIAVYKYGRLDSCVEVLPHIWLWEPGLTPTVNSGCNDDYPYRLWIE